MFGYEFIKTSTLETLIAKLSDSEKNAKTLKRENDVLRFKVDILNKSNLDSERIREKGQFSAKVKMFEPFKIRVTPAQSKRVQEILIEEGETWAGGEKTIHYENAPFLQLTSKGITYWGSDCEGYFQNNKLPEITYRQFMRIYKPKVKPTV